MDNNLIDSRQVLSKAVTLNCYNNVKYIKICLFFEKKLCAETDKRQPENILFY